MPKIKADSFITIQAFMVTDLKLKGNELIAYALIYGFCRQEQVFTGSLQYVADWLNCSKQCAINTLKALCQKGLIEKNEVERNRVKFCEYRLKKLNGSQNYLPPSQKSLPPQSKKLTGGSQKSLPNNILDNIADNIKDNIGREAPQPEAPKEEKGQRPLKAPKPQRHKYGEYSNVLLTDEDLTKLKAEFPGDWSRRIDRLSEYMASTGKSYKNHLATIRNWARRDAETGRGPQKEPDQESEPDYSNLFIQA